jgi:hypothetical protein
MLWEYDGESGGGLDALEDTETAQEDIEVSGAGRFKLEVAVLRLRVFSERST